MPTYRGEFRVSPVSSQKVFSVRVLWPPAAGPLGTRAPARYAGGMAARRPYPSDLSDARWALAEPTLTAWRERVHRAGLGIGRPPRARVAVHPGRHLVRRPHRHPL